MIGIALILGVLIFVFARHLFGPRAAVLAVALYTLEPTVLAHGRIVQTDLPSALTYLLFSFALYFYLQTPSARTALYVGLSAGLALATKFSMVALAPFVVLPLLGLFVFAPKLGQRRGLVAAQMVIAMATLIVVLNAAYFFYHRPPVSYATVLSVTGGLESGDELVALSPSGEELRGTGVLEGRIADEPRGDEGFGYDPIFVPAGEERTVAELGNEWKAENSHRARAARDLLRAFNDR